MVNSSAFPRCARNRFVVCETKATAMLLSSMNSWEFVIHLCGTRYTLSPRRKKLTYISRCIGLSYSDLLARTKALSYVPLSFIWHFWRLRWKRFSSLFLTYPWVSCVVRIRRDWSSVYYNPSFFGDFSGTQVFKKFCLQQGTSLSSCDIILVSPHGILYSMHFVRFHHFSAVLSLWLCFSCIFLFVFLVLSL